MGEKSLWEIIMGLDKDSCTSMRSFFASEENKPDWWTGGIPFKLPRGAGGANLNKVQLQTLLLNAVTTAKQGEDGLFKWKTCLRKHYIEEMIEGLLRGAGQYG